MRPLRTHMMLAILVSLLLVTQIYTTNTHILQTNISWQFIVFITSITIMHIFWIRFWEYGSSAVAYLGVYTVLGGMLSVTLLQDIIVYLASGVSLYRFLLTFAVMGLIGLFIVLFDKKVIVIQFFILAMVMTNGYQYVKKVYLDDGKIAQQVAEDYEKLTVQHTFVNKHNVYYLVPDTYPSFHKLQQQDTFKNRAMYDFLVKNNFAVQENAFSNWNWTLSSMATAFRMYSLVYKEDDDKKHLKKIRAYVFTEGKSITVKTFIENGYNVYYRNTSPDMDAIEDKRLHNNLDEFWVLINLTQTEPLLKKIHRLFNIKKEIAPPYFYTKLQEIPVDKNPKFVYLHAEAVHRNTNDCFDTIDKDWYNIQTYYEQIKCTNTDIKKTVEYLQKTDPNAIIILQADHGRSNFENSLDTLEYDAVLSEYGILFAVKWPDECAYLGQERYTPVNLFPRVFACLSGKKPDYQSLKPDITYRLAGVPQKQYKVMENFKYIQNIAQ